jgi:hypothetical protein
MSARHRILAHQALWVVGAAISSLGRFLPKRRWSSVDPQPPAPFRYRFTAQGATRPDSALRAPSGGMCGLSRGLACWARSLFEAKSLLTLNPQLRFAIASLRRGLLVRIPPCGLQSVGREGGREGSPLGQCLCSIGGLCSRRGLCSTRRAHNDK